MPAAVDRRSFLRHAVLGGTASLASALGASSAPAIEPIRRTGTPKFKFSAAAYSYRELLAGPSPQLTLADFVADCAKWGLEGTELTSYYFPKDVTPEYLRAIKLQAFQLGLDISGTAVGNDFCLPPGPKRDEQFALVKRWIDYAEILGAPVIRIFSGKARKGQDPAEAHRLAVAGMEESCDYAGQHGVCLALENHGGLTSEPDGMLALVRDVKSPWFGVNVDTGNFHGSDPYEDLARIAPYALNVQIKVVVQPASGAKEPADLKRLASIMRTAGYRGYIVLEYEEKKDPRVACPRYLDQLREAFA
jgi:sugar phosphate isomerase/epimerase